MKFHWKPLLGVHSVLWDEALKISGKDPDFHRRDLWEAIESGRFPEWELGLQIVEEKDEHKFDFDLLDPTKIIPEELVPVQRVGRLTLNRNPDNFFAETEQVAFHPGHIVPGIDFTNDPLLQGRLFSYTRHAAHSPRRPELPRDPDQPAGGAGAQQPARRLHAADDQPRPGQLRTRTRSAAAVRCRRAAAQGGFVTLPERCRRGRRCARAARSFFDHFSQATLFFNSQSEHEQQHIVQALRFELGKVEAPPIRERMVGMLAQVDAAWPTQVAEGLGIAVPAKAGRAAEPQRARRRRPEGVSAAAVPSRRSTRRRAQHGRHGQGHGKTRKVAILAADGVDAAAVAAHAAALTAAGAQVEGRRAAAAAT